MNEYFFSKDLFVEKNMYICNRIRLILKSLYY